MESDGSRVSQVRVSRDICLHAVTIRLVGCTMLVMFCPTKLAVREGFSMTGLPIADNLDERQAPLAEGLLGSQSRPRTWKSCIGTILTWVSQQRVGNSESC